MIDQHIIKVNGRLKQAGIRVTIERKGNRLYLRGIFPPKPQHGKLHPYQQRLCLDVGATTDGLKFAEAKAKEVSAKLDLHQFRWEDYEENITESFDIAEAIANLQTIYFKEHPRTKTTLETWQREYEHPLNQLTNYKELSIESLEDALFSLTEPDTRKRRRYALAFAKLADLIGLDGGQIREKVGCYGINSLNPRSIPPDKEILAAYKKLDDDWFKSAYGLMAAYGLRNHEVYHAVPYLFCRPGENL